MACPKSRNAITEEKQNKIVLKGFDYHEMGFPLSLLSNNCWMTPWVGCPVVHMSEQDHKTQAVLKVRIGDHSSVCSHTYQIIPNWKEAV